MVNAEQISAKYENGIMAIVLPKKEEAKPKAQREIKVL
jgi:HSP20 family molecular chaperone IbpA